MEGLGVEVRTSAVSIPWSDDDSCCLGKVRRRMVCLHVVCPRRPRTSGGDQRRVPLPLIVTLIALRNWRRAARSG
jgi:hypothetical protein